MNFLSIGYKKFNNNFILFLKQIFLSIRLDIFENWVFNKVLYSQNVDCNPSVNTRITKPQRIQSASA